MEKVRKIAADGSASVEKKIRSGLRWEDVEIDMATHVNDVSGKEFQKSVATLYVRESKTGSSREVPCNAGDFFDQVEKILR